MSIDIIQKRLKLVITNLYSFNYKKNSRQILLVLLFFCSTITVIAQQNLSSVSYSIIGEKGEIIIEKNPNSLLIPASITKIITTATALNIFAPSYRFKTHLAYSGEIKQGILYGDLYLIGKGDPTIGSHYFDKKKEALFIHYTKILKRLKIKKIKGRVIANATFFDTEGISAFWLWEDLGNYYAAGSYGLNLYDNRYALYLSTKNSNRKLQIDSINPPLSDYTFEKQVKVTNRKKDSLYLHSSPFSNHHFLYGEAPAHRKKIIIYGAIQNPPLFMAQEFERFLIKRNIQIEKRATTVRKLRLINASFSLPKTRKIAIYLSPTLSEIIKLTNHKSNNLFAETLLRLIGTTNNRQGSAINGIQTILSYWEKQGIKMTNTILKDGSGLSPCNAISSSFFSQLLYKMRTSSSFPEFKESLPIGGKKGTVRYFLQHKNKNITIFVKSGSMSYVQCYAGYIKKKNKTYTFSIMYNHFKCNRKIIIKEIEQLLYAQIINNPQR